MEINSQPFEEKLVTDVSARYDNSTVDFTLQEGDTSEELDNSFHYIFKNPNGLKSYITLFKQGLRAISFHQRRQRYRLDLPEVTSAQESTGPANSTPQAPIESGRSSIQGPESPA